eukprot:TRINITY_DN11069_c0_g1_i2.p2 TRINITY_DN11069_c0_g1~~TRINITY_DN11069_c0_g1_i2.p2  ORF type:complete len:204 (-),score=2.41 TRINITY_DN11069_c0_g1_i2:365-976(-)
MHTVLNCLGLSIYSRFSIIRIPGDQRNPWEKFELIKIRIYLAGIRNEFRTLDFSEKRESTVVRTPQTGELFFLPYGTKFYFIFFAVFFVGRKQKRCLKKDFKLIIVKFAEIQLQEQIWQKSLKLHMEFLHVESFYGSQILNLYSNAIKYSKYRVYLYNIQFILCIKYTILYFLQNCSANIVYVLLDAKLRQKDYCDGRTIQQI